MEFLSFGPWLWWCRCAFLGELAGCRRALVLGDGDGRFTARLLRTNSAVAIDAVDSSPAMVRALTRRAGPQAASRLRTYCADARCWQPAAPSNIVPNPPPYDLIVTHFLLDCLTTEEIQALAARLRGSASSSPLWLVSEFAVPPGGFARLLARPLVAGLYWSFGKLTGLAVRTLPNHAAALCASGFTLQKSRVWLGGLLCSELWSAGQPDPVQNPASSRSKPAGLVTKC
jgi:SAM-dependent methyltransferase